MKNTDRPKKVETRQSSTGMEITDNVEENFEVHCRQSATHKFRRFSKVANSHSMKKRGINELELKNNNLCKKQSPQAGKKE